MDYSGSGTVAPGMLNALNSLTTVYVFGKKAKMLFG